MKKQTGATMVEYGILIALIGVLNVAELGSMGISIANKFDDAATLLASPQDNAPN